jgi:hypothetical protein
LKNLYLYQVGTFDERVMFRLEQLITLLIGTWAAPAMTYAIVLRQRDGVSPRLGAALVWGFTCWAGTLGYRVLSGLVVTLGLVLLILPGLIAWAGLYLVECVVAVERPSSSALRRSWNLSKGYRGRIFASGLILVVLVVAAAVGLGLLFELVDDNWVTASAFDYLSDLALALLVAHAATLYLGIRANQGNRCRGCGYDLSGNRSGVCPECGASISLDLRDLPA